MLQNSKRVLISFVRDTYIRTFVTIRGKKACVEDRDLIIIIIIIIFFFWGVKNQIWKLHMHQIKIPLNSSKTPN